MIRILETKQVGRLLARKAARFTEAEAVVRPILEAVRRRGDRALMEYARSRWPHARVASVVTRPLSPWTLAHTTYRTADPALPLTLSETHTLFVPSGYVGVRNGMPGNVLLAFRAEP